MAGNLARVSASNDNINELEPVGFGRPGRAAADPILCPDLCTDFHYSRGARKGPNGKKRQLTPSLIDDLRAGKLDDPETSGLAVEVLPTGKKRWRFRRRIARSGVTVKLTLGLFPAYSIAAAREWARGLSLQIDAGIDPRETARLEDRLASMTVDRAHALYMEAVREGRSSRAKRPNKPRTIADKLELYQRDIAPKLGHKIIYDVAEADLTKLVEAKGKTARIRANRLAAELRVFFGWASSLRGLAVGLEADPSRRLGDLRFPETARTRVLSLQEIEWLLRALVDEEWDYRRGTLLWLLTAARLAEVVKSRSEEVFRGRVDDTGRAHQEFSRAPDRAGAVGPGSYPFGKPMDLSLAARERGAGPHPMVQGQGPGARANGEDGGAADSALLAARFQANRAIEHEAVARGL